MFYRYILCRIVGLNELCLFLQPPQKKLSLVLKVFDFDEPLPLNTAIRLLKTLKDFNAILS